MTPKTFDKIFHGLTNDKLSFLKGKYSITCGVKITCLGEKENYIKSQILWLPWDCPRLLWCYRISMNCHFG